MKTLRKSPWLIGAATTGLLLTAAGVAEADAQPAPAASLGTLEYGTNLFYPQGCQHNGSTVVCTFAFVHQAETQTIHAGGGGSQLTGIQFIDDAHVPHKPNNAYFVDRYGARQHVLTMNRADQGTMMVEFPLVDARVTSGQLQLGTQVLAGIPVTAVGGAAPAAAANAPAGTNAAAAPLRTAAAPATAATPPVAAAPAGRGLRRPPRLRSRRRPRPAPRCRAAAIRRSLRRRLAASWIRRSTRPRSVAPTRRPPSRRPSAPSAMPPSRSAVSSAVLRRSRTPPRQHPRSRRRRRPRPSKPARILQACASRERAETRARSRRNLRPRGFFGATAETAPSRGWCPEPRGSGSPHLIAGARGAARRHSSG